MRLLGVDLASQPNRTSVAVLDGGRVTSLLSRADDDTIVEMAATCDAVGIDAPLGWPDAFVDTITAHHRGEHVPAHAPRQLQLRRTDVVVHESTGKRPLSVSTDRIGVVALRAIGLLERIAGAGSARDGSARVHETYPGGAVAAWALVESSYKPKEATEQRGRIVDALGRYLDLNGFDGRLTTSDDDLDAVLCAAIVGLAVTGKTIVASDTDIDNARREGWIHVPSGSISDLALLGSTPTD